MEIGPHRKLTIVCVGYLTLSRDAQTRMVDLKAVLLRRGLAGAIYHIERVGM